MYSNKYVPDIDKSSLNELHKRLISLSRLATLIPSFVDNTVGEKSDVKALVDSMTNLGGIDMSADPETLTEVIYDEILPVFQKFYDYLVDDKGSFLLTCSVEEIPELAELSIKCIVMHAQTLNEYCETISKYSKTLSTKISAQLKHIQPNIKSAVADEIEIDVTIPVSYIVARRVRPDDANRDTMSLYETVLDYVTSRFESTNFDTIMTILMDFSTNDKLQKALAVPNRRGRSVWPNTDKFTCDQDEYTDFTKQEPYYKAHFVKCPDLGGGGSSDSDSEAEADSVESARNYISSSITSKLTEAIESAMDSLSSSSNLKNMDEYYEKLNAVYKQLNKQIDLSASHMSDIELLVANTIEDVTNIRKGDSATINFAASKQCANLFMYTYLANSYQILNIMHKKLADIRKLTAAIREQRNILSTLTTIRVSVVNLFKQYIGEFAYPLLTTIPAGKDTLQKFYYVTCKSFGAQRIRGIIQNFVENYSAGFVMSGLSIVPLELLLSSPSVSSNWQVRGIFSNSSHYNRFLDSHSLALAHYVTYISEYFYARTLQLTQDPAIVWKLTGLARDSETVKKELDKRTPSTNFYSSLDIDGAKIHATFSDSTLTTKVVDAKVDATEYIRAFSTLSPRGGRQSTNLINRQIMISAVEPLILLGLFGYDKKEVCKVTVEYIKSIPDKPLFNSLRLRLIVFSIIAAAKFDSNNTDTINMNSSALPADLWQVASEILKLKSAGRAGSGIVTFNGTQIIIDYKKVRTEAKQLKSSDSITAKVDMPKLLKYLEDNPNAGLPVLTSYIKHDTDSSEIIPLNITFNEARHKTSLPLSILSAISFDQAFSGGNTLTINESGVIHCFYFNAIDKIIISLV